VQVRVKWSRKKASHGDDTLAALFSQYGHVTAVELTGGKGNAALVTFDSPAAAAAAAAANSTGDTLRATRVSGGFTIPSHSDTASGSSSGWAAQAPGCVTDTDFESVVMGRMRQAAERDRLIREMQQENGSAAHSAASPSTATATAAAATAASGSSAPAAAVAEEDVLSRMLRQSAAQQQQQQQQQQSDAPQQQSDSPQQPTALREDDILARMMAMSGAAASSATAC
jgi:hypothetical protein